MLGLLTVSSAKNCISRLWFATTDSLNIFGTPNAVITPLWLLHTDLTTISYSDNFILDSILRNGANLSTSMDLVSWYKSIRYKCLLASSIEKTLIAQKWFSGLFMTHALAVCNTIAVTLFTKQVPICSLAGDVILLSFWSALAVLGLVCCE